MLNIYFYFIFTLKNIAYNTGMNNKVISVLTSNPPMMTTAAGPKSGSLNSGIIPKMVVIEVSITGRNRRAELSSNAFTGSIPCEI